MSSCGTPASREAGRRRVRALPDQQGPAAVDEGPADALREHVPREARADGQPHQLRARVDMAEDAPRSRRAALRRAARRRAPPPARRGRAPRGRRPSRSPPRRRRRGRAGRRRASSAEPTSRRRAAGAPPAREAARELGRPRIREPSSSTAAGLDARRRRPRSRMRPLPSRRACRLGARAPGRRQRRGVLRLPGYGDFAPAPTPSATDLPGAQVRREHLSRASPGRAGRLGDAVAAMA